LSSKDYENKVIYEIVSAGRYLKVTAVDPESGIEATVVGPAENSAVNFLKSLALKKLIRLKSLAN
jgi:hypothetical protein